MRPTIPEGFKSLWVYTLSRSVLAVPRRAESAPGVFAKAPSHQAQRRVRATERGAHGQDRARVVRGQYQATCDSREFGVEYGMPPRTRPDINMITPEAGN